MCFFSPKLALFLSTKALTFLTKARSLSNTEVLLRFDAEDLDGIFYLPLLTLLLFGRKLCLASAKFLSMIFLWFVHLPKHCLSIL